MSQTTWSGPLASGDKAAGIAGGPNIGLVRLTQTATLNVDATLVQNVSFNLPVNSIIDNVQCDVITAYDSATSATFSAGTSSGDTSYVSGVSVKSAGRKTQGYTGAQLLAMSNTGSNTTVVATVTSVGQPTTGKIFVTVSYTQTTGS